jgi:predicted RNA binding protein YcfA (HicA-like mRNA interferase family)
MKLPIVSGDDVIKALKKAGFEVVRQRGSHVSLHKRTPHGVLLTVVPRKPEIKRGTLSSILRQAGISREEFLKLL